MSKDSQDPELLAKLKPIEDSFVDMCVKYSVSVDDESARAAEYLASTHAIKLLMCGYSVFDLYDFMKAELDDFSS